MEPTTSEWIEVRKSSIHNMGVFAAKDIPEGTKIIEYVGEKLTKEESDRRGDVVLEEYKKDAENKGGVYIFEIDKKHDIDGNVPWNTARLINHSCDPNCDPDIIKGHIYIIAIKDIKMGEELFYNYGYDIDDFEEHPCYCGSKKCVGFILDKNLWPRMKRTKKWRRLMQERKKKENTTKS